MGHVKIIRTYYLGDSVWDGSYLTDHVQVIPYENVTAREAYEILKSEGLSFAATGGSGWAADPDGSYVTDYRTGMECETSGHLSGFPERVVDAIERAVG